MKTEAPQQVGTDKELRARNAGMALSGVEADVTTHLRTKAELEQASGLMDAVCERGNLKHANQRAIENKGAAGIDGIGVAELKTTSSNTGRRSRPNCWRVSSYPSRYAGRIYRSRKAG